MRIEEEARLMLEQRRVALLKLERLQGRQVNDEHASAETSEERAIVAEGSEVWQVLSARERREILEIEAALARMASNSFGRCEACGQAIGRQRLKAVPEARHCVSCSAASDVTRAPR